MSQTAGSVLPEYLTRVVGCRKHGGKGAVRISRLNTRVPGGSGDSPLSCSGSKHPPRRGVYFLPLMMLWASPSPACLHVSWRRSLAGVFPMRSCTEGAFASCTAAAFPFPPRWSVHRNLMVLSCSPTELLRDYRAHARRKALGLLYNSLLDERLCLAVQVATQSRRRLGHCLE